MTIKPKISHLQLIWFDAETIKSQSFQVDQNKYVLKNGFNEATWLKALGHTQKY